MLLKGYRDDALNADAFDADGRFRTGDRRPPARRRPHHAHRAARRTSSSARARTSAPKRSRTSSTTHPKVRRLAVIGLPDRERGERVCAVVETPPGQEPLTFAEMQQFCRDARLMTQKIPEQLEVRRRAAAQRDVQDPQARTGQAVHGGKAHEVRLQLPGDVGARERPARLGRDQRRRGRGRSRRLRRLRAHRAPDPGRQLARARRPPDARPVRRPRVRGGGHRAHPAADPPVGRAVPQPVPPRQDRGHARPLLAGPVRPRARRRATTRPSSSPSASTSTSATRSSTRRWRCLPKAWSGEPFDAAGLHFTAKGVIQRPRPAQDPIPIWIGGNSKLSRRRAATVQGWMPMGIPEEVARTTRSPHISGLEQLAGMIAEVKDLAGDRAGELDFCMSYMEEGIHQPTSDVQRHVDGLGRMEEAGRHLRERRPPADHARSRCSTSSRPSARPTSAPDPPRNRTCVKVAA